jgi:hypothetical protein
MTTAAGFGPVPLQRRIFEVIPGLLIFGMVGLVVSLILNSPTLMFVIGAGYVMYWALRSVEMGVRQVIELGNLRRYEDIDWSFRLDRLTDPRRTGARFRPRPLPADDAAAFVRAGLSARAPVRHEVEVLVHAPAARVEAVVGRWARVEDQGERSVLRTDVEDLAWPAMMLGGIGAEFEVRTPDALRALLADWAVRFARAGEGSGVRG